MNPFLHSTVAQPLPATHPSMAAPFGSPKPTTVRWRRLARRAAMAAGVGLVVCHAATAAGVNVNIATVEQLQAVRGIGPKTAETIVRERERSGPFESFQDFAERIRGIGPKRAQTLRAAGLTVSSSPARPSAMPAR